MLDYKRSDEAKSGREPLLSVIVPVYNEEKTIGQILARIRLAPYSKQVVIVDDGSSDGSADAIREYLLTDSAAEFFQHPKNRGKGAAIRTGLAAVRGTFTIVQDADLEYDPSEYPTLVEVLKQGSAEVVYGSRYYRGQTRESGRRCSEFGISLLNFAVRALYGAKLTDEATCFKAFSTSVLKSLDLECERFEFCPEVTAKVLRAGHEILEVPITYQPRSVEEGKKIRLTDGWEALATLWKYRKWIPRHAEAAGRTVIRPNVLSPVPSVANASAGPRQ